MLIYQSASKDRLFIEVVSFGGATLRAPEPTANIDDVDRVALEDLVSYSEGVQLVFTSLLVAGRGGYEFSSP